MLRDKERIREIIRILMDSAFYFELSLIERYNLICSFIKE